jgi:hypothetical protein
MDRIWNVTFFSHIYLCKIGFTHARKPCWKFLSYMSCDVILHTVCITSTSQLYVDYKSSTKQQQWQRNAQYP